MAELPREMCRRIWAHREKRRERSSSMSMKSKGVFSFERGSFAVPPGVYHSRPPPGVSHLILGDRDPRPRSPKPKEEGRFGTCHCLFRLAVLPPSSTPSHHRLFACLSTPLTTLFGILIAHPRPTDGTQTCLLPNSLSSI